jgi:hypothetical protein
MEFTDACLNAATGQSGSSMCDTIGQSMGSCAYASGVCKCQELLALDEDEKTQTETGTYKTSGSTLTVTSSSASEEGEGPTEMRYCVKGSQASLEVVEDDESVTSKSY